MIDTDLIERLQADTQRLRTRVKTDTDTFRWIGMPLGWRKKSDLADDIEALIALVVK